MTLRLEGIRLALPDFELRLDLTFGATVTAIVGPSGAGKTSLLEIVAGLRAPAAGRVTLDGRLLEDPASGARLEPRDRGIGYLTQDDTLFPHLSAERNLRYGARGGRPDERRFERVVAALGLAPFLRRLPRELSGGERRRVALGRALLAARRLLLLDEPSSGLDGERRAAVNAVLAAVKADLATPVLWVTHRPDETSALADETIEMDEGKVVRQIPARPDSSRS